MDYAGRQERLRLRLQDDDCDTALVAHPANVRYLCGYAGPGGSLVVGRQRVVLLVDPIDRQLAADTAADVEVLARSEPWPLAEARLARSLTPAGLALEREHLRWRELSELQAARTGARLVSAAGLVEVLRYLKDPEETAVLRRAQALTDEALRAVLPEIRPGASQLDLAARLEFEARRRGSEGVPYPTLVTSGAGGAVVHAPAGPVRLAAGELVSVDFGVRLGGYCSDTTRTWALGPPDPMIERAYAAVAGAMRETLRQAVPGVRLAKLHRVARRVIEEAGFGEYFRHSLGHGVGLEVHEQPSVDEANELPLEVGMVLAIEPGIAIPGCCGVRIENVVYIGDEGPEILSGLPWRDLESLSG